VSKWFARTASRFTRPLCSSPPLRTSPKAMLGDWWRQRWANRKSQWHLAPPTPSSVRTLTATPQRNGVQVLALLRTLALNLLRLRTFFRSIRRWPDAVAHDISRMLVGRASAWRRRDDWPFQSALDIGLPLARFRISLWHQENWCPLSPGHRCRVSMVPSW